MSFRVFMSNVSIINVFYRIFVSEAIFKTRIIKTKRTRTTFFNLTLLPSCNYLGGLVLFDNNASWHWTMACRNWELQSVLPISSYKVWIESVQYFFCDCYVCICVFLLILLCISNLNTILHFLLVSSVFTFSPSVLELLIHKIFCLKINILLYCIGPVSYIYQQISYTCMLNTISSFNVLYFMYFFISFYFRMET